MSETDGHSSEGSTACLVRQQMHSAENRALTTELLPCTASRRYKMLCQRTLREPCNRQLRSDFKMIWYEQHEQWRQTVVSCKLAASSHGARAHRSTHTVCRQTTIAGPQHSAFGTAMCCRDQRNRVQVLGTGLVMHRSR